MRVEIIPSGTLRTKTSGPVPWTDDSPYPCVSSPKDYPASYGDWAPRAVLGAASPGGLLLPSATPTAAWLYAPRGVWLDDERVAVADSGNHRVLIWHGHPATDGVPADVILGQPDETSDGPAASGRGPANGMHLPTGVLVDQGRLVVADAWHHRILVWDHVPSRNDASPVRVIGQADLRTVAPNAGQDAVASASSLYWPFGLAVVNGWFVVADTGNRRVLLWRDGIPRSGQVADVVLGQPDERSREENRGGPVCASSFRWPHAVAGDGRGGLLVADAGNHRVLWWRTIPSADCPADAVLGQPDLHTGSEFPYVPQRGRLRFPYGLTSCDETVALADTANNRVLIWPDFAVDDAADVIGAEPEIVLGQPDLSANGENRWEQVSADSLCWPYGLAMHRAVAGDTLAVADSGNNRVVLWERRR